MIRKVYSDLIHRKILEEGPGWLLKRSGQYLLLHLSALLRRPLCGPALGTLMVTYRCNLHCSMCDMPLRAASQARAGISEYSTERFKEVIRDFARLGIPGIGFTGGEPLVRDDIFELLAETRRLGMISHLNSNGWLLDDNAADKLIETGIDSLNISLDGASAKTHDAIRRAKGSFEHAVKGIQRVIERKKHSNSSLRVKTVAVLDKSNIAEVPQMFELGAELGIDCIELIPRQRFTVPEAETEIDQELIEKVDSLIRWLTANRLPVPVENSPRHLRLFKNSFSGEPSPIHCKAGYNSLAVDCYGNLFPCVPWINWGKTTGDINVVGLEELWRSKEYQQEREKTVACRDCYLNCQTELNLLFSILH